MGGTHYSRTGGQSLFNVDNPIPFLNTCHLSTHPNLPFPTTQLLDIPAIPARASFASPNLEHQSKRYGVTTSPNFGAPTYSPRPSSQTPWFSPPFSIPSSSSTVTLAPNYSPPRPPPPRYHGETPPSIELRQDRLERGDSKDHDAAADFAVVGEPRTCPTEKNKTLGCPPATRAEGVFRRKEVKRGIQIQRGA